MELRDKDIDEIKHFVVGTIQSLRRAEDKRLMMKMVDLLGLINEAIYNGKLKDAV